MRELTYKDAINEALMQTMEADPTIIMMGEDIAGGAGRDDKGGLDAWGGPFGVTKGLRPIVELMYADFVGVCYDQLLNQAAKMRYMFGGKQKVPMVVRTVVGAGFRAAAEHSQTLYSLYTHVPGLKTIAPSTPADAKGLLIAAIQDDDPVIFFEHKRLYMTKGDVPQEAIPIPLGKADIKRQGKHVTVVGVQRMVNFSLQAAEELSKEGIEAEVIDPRCYSPLDEETILESVTKTGYLVIVDESYPRCNLATDIAALVADKGFDSLKGPIKCLTAPHTPVPFSPPMEDFYLPSSEKIANTIRKLLHA